METQDSIDIAKLQRVALGLEHETSQPFLPDLGGTHNTSQTKSSRLIPSTIPSHGDASPTSLELSAQSSSKTPQSSLQRKASLPAATKHAKASMSSHDSARNSNSTQSADRLAPRQMNSIEDDPGDTQVVSQSVYDSIIRHNGDSTFSGGLSHNGGDGATLKTLHEGDSGHLDILAEFNSLRQEKNQSPANDEESIYGQSPSSPIADHGLQPEFFPESQRFLTTTPATAIKKHQTPGTAQTPSASRNPLLADIGSSGGLLMGLSQAFKNTQAPSSPLVHGPQSEIASDRPSPNVPIQRRVQTTASSPLVNFNGQFARESSEPNLNYISLKESQNNRDKSLGRRLTRSVENLHSGDQLDQDFYQEPSFLVAARRQREIDEEAAAQFAALNTPGRPRSDAGASSPVNSIHIHEDDAIGLDGAGSEEETEQEDDAGPQVPQSQEAPPSSMEEDKENYMAPHEPVANTSSAHDRLSQALGIEESQSRTDHGDGTEQQDLGDANDADVLVGRSSQVMVKNSQQTPRVSPGPESARNGLQAVPEEMEIDTHIDVARTSPAHQRLESPTPASRPATGHSQNSHGDLRQESSRSQHYNEPGGSENQPTYEDRPAPALGHSQPLSQGGSLLQSTGSYLGDKPSSLPSQIKETPIHLRPSVSDTAQISKVPNTSPGHDESNRWEMGSNGNNEDDDLPPMFPVGNPHRLSQQRASQTRAQSSPIKNKPSILSSPSGRQRRRLMDIASDTSPQVHSKVVDIDMSFFANDPDFNALIQGSPTRPKKRRRGNLGQSFNTSEITDIVPPAAPREQPPKAISPVQEVSSPAKTQSSADIQPPTPTVRRQSGLSRRADANVWEIESSPQQVMPRRPKHKRIQTFSRRHTQNGQSEQSQQPRSERSAEPQAQVSAQQPEIQPQDQQSKRPERQPTSQSLPRPAAIIQNSLPALSSELTELDVGSECLLSSDNPPASAPTSPQPGPASIDERQIAPRQVIALWPDRKRAYYPGACLGSPIGALEPKYSVKLEDSLPFEVKESAVKRLELRIGDGVKVEMPGVPRVTHIVRGFEDKVTREELTEAADKGEPIQTDVYGYSTLVLGPKQRKSLPNGGLSNHDSTIRVPVARIYLDTILWNQLKDRDYTHQPEAERPQESLPQTPAKSSLPASPSARFSRNIQGADLFSNVAFAVSYKDDDDSKNNILRLIQENGGSLLRNSFTELFESPSAPPAATPTKSHSRDLTPVLPGLTLANSAQNIGFTCLIANTHSRREKFMQALALNIPCLSGRWVEDCVAKGRLLDWDIYLLPAGDSMYLNGATRSRILTPTPPSQARLTQTISMRPRLFDSNSVLVIMRREEKREAYIFLARALGAARVERAPDLETARTMLEAQSDAGNPCVWDFVCVEDTDRDSAKDMLVPRPVSQRGQSRKRKKSAAFNTDSISGASSATRVVGAEFVCQSLILGRLYEE